MSYRKYLYGDREMATHEKYLRLCGCLSTAGWRQKTPTPGRPPKMTAKATKSQPEGRKGRNKVKCERYRREGRREINKARRIKKNS